MSDTKNKRFRFRLRIPVIVDEGEKMGMDSSSGFDAMSLLLSPSTDVGVRPVKAFMTFYIDANSHQDALDSFGDILSLALRVPRTTTSDGEAEIRRKRIHEVKDDE